MGWVTTRLTLSYILPQQDPFLSGNYRLLFQIRYRFIEFPHCAITVLKNRLLHGSGLEDGVDGSGK